MIDSSRKIKVCHLASGDLWAGAEAHVSNLLPELAKLPGVSVHAILLNDGVLAERLYASRLQVSVLPEVRLSAPTLIKALARLLRETGTDLLHTHGYKQNILGSMAGKLACVPWIVRTEHGVKEPFRGWAGLRMEIYQVFDRLAASQSSAIVAVSEDLAKYWRSWFNGQGPRVVVVPNAVPIPQEVDSEAVAQTRARLGIREDQVLFGTLGRIVPIKGLAHLLEAAALLRAREKHCVFLIAGDGPMRPYLEARAAELCLQDMVRFLGFTREPAELLAALDVFVLPSLGEGVPIALLEALALGKAVVATAVGGVAELLSDGVHAILVQPGASTDLAQACEQLIINPTLRGTLGEHGRTLVRERLSAVQMASEVHDLYRLLVKQSSGAEGQ